MGLFTNLSHLKFHNIYNMYLLHKRYTFKIDED